MKFEGAGMRVESINCGWVVALSTPIGKHKGGKLTVQFEDSGKIRKNVTLQQFLSGNVSDSNVSVKEGSLLKSTNYGFFKILKIYNTHNITIQWENTGNIQTKMTKDNLLNGLLKDKIVVETLSKERIRAENIARSAAKERKEQVEQRKQQLRRVQEQKRVEREEKQQQLEQARLARVKAKEDMLKRLGEAPAKILESAVIKDSRQAKDVLNIDFKDRDGKWVLRFSMEGKFVQTRLGKLHNNLTQRTKTEGSAQKVNKAYQGVTLCEEWKDPQVFCEWAVQQPGWGMGYVLEKDLLGMGRRHYSPETCIFIPQTINAAIVPRGNKTSVLNTQSGWVADFSVSGEKIFLGPYPFEENAWAARREYLKAYIKKLADCCSETISSRAYQALCEWEPV